MYSNEPDAFKAAILLMFTKTLDEMQKIPNLEPKVL